MVKALRSPLALFGVAVVLATALSAALVPGVLHNLFSTGSFMPHVHCYLDDPRMVWLQGLSDFLIGAAYMGISGGLGYLVFRARKDIPFEWMFLAFGIFIFSCGWTHFLEVWTLWHPTYWLSGTIKAITAVASVATGIGIIPLVPRVFKFIDAAKSSEQRRRALEQAHAELAAMNNRLRELDELKSRFFANVSHELRTPLTLILGNVENLRHALNLDREQQRRLRVIERNGLVLQQQVNHILDAAKLESGQMQARYAETDLSGLVRLVCSNFESPSRDRGFQFTVQTPPTLPVQADPRQLEQVLANLLSNAFKFTPHGGLIRCTLLQETGGVVLEVADSGPGVPLEARATIFERFRQLDAGDDRRYSGTGLGLCIARDFVQLHHGVIEVGDSPEGGALFTVRLPQKAPEGVQVEPAPITASAPGTLPGREAVAELSPVASPPAPDLSGRTGNEPVVLVVEDNTEMIELIQDTLRPECRTIPATNGAEALTKARSLPPDLILTDLMMPEMSGEQFLHEVRSDRDLDPVPVVVLTARADDHVRVQLLREGAQDYLLKPFTREELRARTGNLIAARRSRRELERANGELEAFSYSLAHDLRAQLRSIRSFAQMLSEEYAPPQGTDASLYLENIINSAGRLDQLVADVLAYTRMDRGPVRLHRVDLDGLLASLIRETAEFQPPRAEIVVRSPLPPVLGDDAALTQAVTNLLANGIKFVSPGIKPRVEISAEQRGDRVRILFKDNGIGIDAKDQQRIFGLFQRIHSQKDYSGTGLGLAIVRKAVERMGGKLGLESALGRGSRFWIELDTPEAPSEDFVHSSAQQTAPNGH